MEKTTTALGKLIDTIVGQLSNVSYSAERDHTNYQDSVKRLFDLVQSLARYGENVPEGHLPDHDPTCSLCRRIAGTDGDETNES